MVTRVALTGDTRGLDEVYLNASQKCSTTYTNPQGWDSKAPREIKKKFNLYVPTPLPEQGWRAEKSELGERNRPEKWKSSQSRKLYTVIIKKIFPMINSATFKEERTIEDQEIQDRIEALVAELCDLIEIPQPTSDYEKVMGNADRSTLTWEMVDRLIVNAIQFCRETWSPEVYRSIQKRAREAGRAYKSYNLDSHLQTAHLNVTAAARQLGISRNSVYAMRREFQDIDLTTEVDHEEATQEASHHESAVTDSSGHQARTEVESSSEPVEIHEQRGSTTPPPHAHRVGASGEELADVVLPF